VFAKSLQLDSSQVGEHTLRVFGKVGQKHVCIARVLHRIPKHDLCSGADRARWIHFGIDHENEIASIIVLITELAVTGGLSRFRQIGHPVAKIHTDLRGREVTIAVGVSGLLSQNSANEKLSELPVVRNRLVSIP